MLIGRTSQLAAVLLMLTAWFLLSNHCALGAIGLPADSEPEMNGCPMHSAPAKKKPATQTPCCKDVRAVVAKGVMATALEMRSTGSQDHAPELLIRPWRQPIDLESLDTGPPGCLSFAELVLQESVRAHAPPVS